MIRIAITEAAFEAIADTLPFGSVSYGIALNERGERLVWLEARVVDQLAAQRGGQARAKATSSCGWSRSRSLTARHRVICVKTPIALSFEG